MLAIALSYYSIIAFIVFTIWFKAFWLDTTTPKTDFLSWLVLIVGASFWVITLPCANLELATKALPNDINHQNCH